MHRRLACQAVAATGVLTQSGFAVSSEGTPTSAPATAPTPSPSREQHNLKVRLVVYPHLTPWLDEVLETALRATGTGLVEVERLATKDMEDIKRHLQDRMASDQPDPCLVALSSTYWLGQRFANPERAIDPNGLRPVWGLCTEPAILGVDAAVNANSTDELIQLVRKRPDRWPAFYQEWQSPAYWLAMLWNQATGSNLTWRHGDAPAFKSEAQEGGSAIYFGSPAVFDRRHSQNLVPLAAWSGDRPVPLPPFGLVAPFSETNPPSLPPPCFVSAVVPFKWQSRHKAEYQLLQSWVRAATATEMFQGRLARHQRPAWSVSPSTVLAAARAQDKAFASATAYSKLKR